MPDTMTPLRTATIAICDAIKAGYGLDHVEPEIAIRIIAAVKEYGERITKESA